jgi:two-component system sensor histidine kinase PilS (NtrC family)
VWLEFDDNQMRQVVWNLATNGLRAMTGRRPPAPGRRASDGAPWRCASRTKAAASSRPTSIGSFQPFRSTFDRGTGLGLATVHRIVTGAKGSIHVSSRVGEGTTMRVVLPAGQGDRRRGHRRGARGGAS